MNCRNLTLTICYISLSFLASGQQLRRFSLFAGADVPDLNLKIGVNYKLLDFLELEGNVNLYKTNSIGGEGGLRYLYNYWKDREVVEVHSLVIGSWYEYMGRTSVGHSVNTPAEGNYTAKEGQFITAGLGYRYYSHVLGNSSKIKEVFVEPMFRMKFPLFTNSPELVSGVPDLKTEQFISRYLNGGFNFTLKFGFVF